jgi:hypothetical protein
LVFPEFGAGSDSRYVAEITMPTADAIRVAIETQFFFRGARLRGRSSLILEGAYAVAVSRSNLNKGSMFR